MPLIAISGGIGVGHSNQSHSQSWLSIIEAQGHTTDDWIIDIVAVCSAKKKPLRKSFPKIASSFRRCVGTIETTTTASMLGIVGFW